MSLASSSGAVRRSVAVLVALAVAASCATHQAQPRPTDPVVPQVVAELHEEHAADTPMPPADEPEEASATPEASAPPKGADAERPETASPENEVAGIVVDPHGIPVPGAHVSIVLDRYSKDSLTTTTGEDGRFRLTDLDALYVRLRVTAPEFMLLARRKTVSLEVGSDDVRIALRDCYVLEGRILDADGTPLTSCRVTAKLLHDVTVLTDPDGRFVLPRLEDPPFQLWIEYRRRCWIEFTPDLTAAIDYCVPGDRVISGTLRRKSGEKIRAAAVAAAPLDAAGEPRGPSHFTVGHGDRFVISGLGPGAHEITAHHADTTDDWLLDENREPLVVESGTTDLEIVLD